MRAALRLSGVAAACALAAVAGCKKSSGSSSGGSAGTNLSGTWAGAYSNTNTCTSVVDTGTFSLALSQSGDNLTGTLTSGTDTPSVTGTVTGNAAAMTVSGTSGSCGSPTNAISFTMNCTRTGDNLGCTLSGDPGCTSCTNNPAYDGSASLAKQ